MTDVDAFSPLRFDPVKNRESGIAMIMVLWILSLMVLVAGTMAIGTRYTVTSTDSITDLRRAQSIAESGIESWIGQLRGDVIVDDVGIQPTEILNHDPIQPPANVRINEAKLVDGNDYTCNVNPGMHVELVNVGGQPVNITGWFGRHQDNTGNGNNPENQLGPTINDDPNNMSNTSFTQGDFIGDLSPSPVWLCPLRGDGSCVNRGPNFHRFFVIGTHDLMGNGIGTGGGVQTIKLCNSTATKEECRTADRGDPWVEDWLELPFSCTGGSPSKCGLTWQVFPDGSHGMKPIINRDGKARIPNNWVKAPCTMDAYVNGDSDVTRRHTSEYDLASGDNDQVTQFNGSGFWLKFGNNTYEGLQFEQFSGNKFNFGSRFSFANLTGERTHGMLDGEAGLLGGGNLTSDEFRNAPYCKRIAPDCDDALCKRNCNFKENFYIDTSQDAGEAMAVITNGLPRHNITDVFPNADTQYTDVNGHTHLVPVIPTGLLLRHLGAPDDKWFPSDAFPYFESDDQHYLSVSIPEPEDQELGAPPPIWNGFQGTDRYDQLFSNLNNAAEINPVETESDEHGWLVRVDTGQVPAFSLNRSGSVPASPDPGTYKPANYVSSYVFNTTTKADSRLYLSESYDSQIVAHENTGSDPTKWINKGCNLKITYGRKDGGGAGSPNFLEIFNPGPHSYVLEKIVEYVGGGFNPVPRWDGSELMKPGEYFVIAAEDHDDFHNSVHGWLIDAVNRDLFKNKAAAFKIEGGRGVGGGGGVPPGLVEVCDRVGIEGHNPPPSGTYEGPNPLDNNSGLVFWRKKSSKFPEDVPMDSGSNEDDFGQTDPTFKSPCDPDLSCNWHHPKNLKWHRADNLSNGFSNYHYFSRSFVEVHQFLGPERKQPEGGEYIEVYNTGDTADVRNFFVRDYLDGRGADIPSGNQYQLKLHSLDPLKGTPDEDKGLKPGQIGVIMRDSNQLDTANVGWRPEGIGPFLQGKDVNNDGKGDTIRVYTTEQSDSFLTGGLHNSIPEHVKIENSKKVISSGTWAKHCAITNRSCYKARVDGSQSSENWNNLSIPGGTPGEVEFVDHLDEEWAWGGKLFTLAADSIPLGDPICVPSMTSCPNPTSTMPAGDFGFFEFLRIEDESGKINVLNPPIQTGYETEPHSLKLGKGNEDSAGASINSDDPSVPGRSFLGAFHTYTPAKDIADYPDSSPTLWMSPGGMMTVGGIVPGEAGYVNNTMDDYEHVYTTMRSDTQNRRININTAPYEALKAIQIQPEGSDPTFLTEAMAKKIIETRSCESSYTPGETLPLENYDCTDNTPFFTGRQACQFLNSSKDVSNTINCTIFASNATTSSGGIFRAEVRGVVVEDSVARSEAIWEVMVDRTAANRGGKVKVIFVREKDDF